MTEHRTTSRPEEHPPVLRLRGASLGFGERDVWSGLDLDVRPGEFLTVLGANGAGKSSLLRVALGLQPLRAGTVEVQGRPARRGDRRIGYVPQQRPVAADTPMRGRDLVGLGLDGHRAGVRLRGRREARRRIDAALGSVQATAYADRPVGRLSGGEQQRLRVAQALVSDPDLLLCDEPLASLDLHHQHAVSALVDRRRCEQGTPVVFVTHDVNPVLPLTDRVLYLAPGGHLLGTPQEVLRSDVLSDLFDTDVEVVRVGERVVVLGVPDHPHHDRGGRAHAQVVA